MKGTVKFFNEKKGFGFITGEDNEEYFVHISQVPQDKLPDKEDEVEFTTETTDKGRQAQNVSFI